MQSTEQSIFDQQTYRTSAPAAAAPNAPKLYRGRPWLAALVAVLTELVVIAGVDNQSVTHLLRKPLNDPSRVLADYSRGAIDAATTYWWRFVAADGQPTHVWAAQFAAIGALVVLTWLGTLAVARGSVTFGRVWVGTWAVITAAAPISIMVRNVLVTPTAPGPAESKIGQSVYGYDAFGPVIITGLVLGLVAGLITAAVAIGSRRQIAAAPVSRASDEQDEYLDDSFVPRYSPPQPYEPRPWGESEWPTTAIPQPPAEQAPAPAAWPPQPPQRAYGWRDAPPAQEAPAEAETTQQIPAPGPTEQQVTQQIPVAEADATQQPAAEPPEQHTQQIAYDDDEFMPTPRSAPGQRGPVVPPEDER